MCAVKSSRRTRQTGSFRKVDKLDDICCDISCLSLILRILPDYVNAKDYYTTQTISSGKVQQNPTNPLPQFGRPAKGGKFSKELVLISFAIVNSSNQAWSRPKNGWEAVGGASLVMSATCALVEPESSAGRGQSYRQAVIVEQCYVLLRLGSTLLRPDYLESLS